MRAIKIRAAEQNRTLQDLIAELLRKGLTSTSSPQENVRATFPLIECAHPNEKVTPDFVSSLLLDQDTDDSLRH